MVGQPRPPAAVDERVPVTAARQPSPSARRPFGSPPSGGIYNAFAHDASDELVGQVAVRLREAVRPRHTVALLGGGEFGVLFSNLGERAARHVCDRIRAALAKPFMVSGNTLCIVPRIGLATSVPGDGLDGDRLLTQARGEMQAAKHASRGVAALAACNGRFNAIREEIKLELPKALLDGSFTVSYQPQVELTSGLIVGAEALVRWPHPRRGIVLPDTFVPVAEEMGLIADLDALVLREACAQIRRWSDAGLPPIRMAVDI